MEKLWEGRDVDLEILERFARGLGLSVNEWRDYWGHPRVEETDPEQLVATVVKVVREKKARGETSYHRVREGEEGRAYNQIEDPAHLQALDEFAEMLRRLERKVAE